MPKMPKSKAARALKKQFEHDLRALRNIHKEQEKLRVAYDRFCALDEQSRIHTERIRRLIVLVAEHEPDDIKKSVTEKAFELDIAIPEGWETVSTWEAIMEVVRQFPNIQVVDLLMYLEQLLGDAVSRQKVDSALETHPELFDVKKSGYKKFVSLKGGADAAATMRQRK